MALDQLYQRLRTGQDSESELSYPSMGDQLDDLYKNGAFSAEMTAKIKAVKEKYPKA